MSHVAEPAPPAATDEEDSSDSARAPEDARAAASFLRHPLVVGAVVAAIGGIFASLLIPAATRSWQDRPRELALKSHLVEQANRVSAAAVVKADAFGRFVEEADGKVGRNRRTSFESAAYAHWQTDSAVIESDLATYFGETSLPRQWTTHEDNVIKYITFMAGIDGERFGLDAFRSILQENFRETSFDDPFAERQRKDMVELIGSEPTGSRSFIAELLRLEREQITRRILDADASGFSHGFWIFD